MLFFNAFSKKKQSPPVRITTVSLFSFLKVLPVKMISIDESFMEKLNDADGDEVAASSIAEVAHYLGKKVLATSVDTAICLQRMTRLGVDFVQGSTVSEPVRL